MILDLSQNGIRFVIDVADNGTLALRECSADTRRVRLDVPMVYLPLVEVQIVGENPDGHHGGKHTDSWGARTLKYVTHRSTENELGNKVELDLRNERLAVTVHYQFYRNVSTLRAWTTVTNVGTENVGLEYVSSFAMTGLSRDGEARLHIPYNATPRELNWKSYTLCDLGLDTMVKGSMQRYPVSNTGTWSCKEKLPLAAYTAPDGAMLWQIEHNGSWSYEIGEMRDNIYLRLSGPTEQENGWYQELAPNERFESIKVALAFGADLDGALASMTRYRRTLYRANEPSRSLPVIFNDYMNCLLGDPTTDKLLPIIDRAADVGAEIFCVDAGWYADGNWWDTVGEWLPCGWRFPNGIREVFDRIHARGMIPGIWLEIEVMGIHCPILPQFEDECFFMRHGKRVIDHGRYQLDFRHPKVRAHAHAVVDRVVKEYSVGYIKFDYNIEAGVGTEVDADSFGDGLLGHGRALLSWFEEVRERHPALIIENCSSGGMRMDYAMLSVAHLQSTSDQTDYRHTATIASNAATALIPEQAAVWSYPLAAGDEHEASFNMVNALLHRIHLSGEIAKLSERQLSDVKEGVRLYKTIRSFIPRAVPFYPLGLNAYNADFCCVGYRDGHEAYIAVWRVNAAEGSCSLPVSATSVEVFYPTNRGAAATIEGERIRVTLPNQNSAAILKVTLA